MSGMREGLLVGHKDMRVSLQMRPRPVVQPSEEKLATQRLTELTPTRLSTALF